MTITEADWLSRLPEAVAPHRLILQKQGARISFDGRDDVALTFAWEIEPERRIALIRLPQLRVHFQFHGLSASERTAFMQRFDLHMQRGGG